MKLTIQYEVEWIIELQHVSFIFILYLLSYKNKIFILLINTFRSGFCCWSEIQRFQCSMMSDFERIRLVLLGGAGVGKSCIIRRFLNKTYCDKYRPTVEDLHNREYDLGSVTLKVCCSFFPLNFLNFWKIYKIKCHL